jgi:hypothetical protein
MFGGYLRTANVQDSRTLRAFLEQEAAEGAEKVCSLRFLCSLLFKILMFWLRGKAATETPRF